MNRLFTIILLFIVTNNYVGCSIKYSFTGASISPETKTFAVNYFPNRAPIINATLSQDFTEKLKDKFIQQTSLKLSNINADLVFEGEITDYKVSPLAIQGNQTAALNRLTITMHVIFYNALEPSKNFDTYFSAFEDFESSIGFETIENELTKSILDKIIEDIFNKAVANW